MNTVILKWNPSISSYPMIGLLQTIIQMNNEGGDGIENWSVHDFEKIHKGDIFYFVKLGFGANGIVAHGKITSEPYEGKSWAGSTRKTYYVDMVCDFLVNPDTFPILTSAELTEAIPDFDWFKGHSGIVLSDSDSAILTECFYNYLHENKAMFQERIEKSKRNGFNEHVFVGENLL